MSETHTKSKFVAEQGFAQSQDAVRYPVASIAVVNLGFATASYTVTLPVGVTIFDTDFVVGTAFSGGTSPAFKIGTTVGGNDVLASTSLSGGSAGFSPAFVALPNPATVYVTITGAPTAGSAVLLIHFINQ